MKRDESVAIITVATIAKPEIISLDSQAKLELVKHIKAGWKIISAVPTHTNEIACITYILQKEPHADLQD